MNNPKRRGLLAKVHIARKELGLTEEEYRAILEARFGVESAGELRVPELARLCNYFLELGWKGPGRARPTGTPRQESGFIEIPDSDPHADQKRWILAMIKALGWKVSGINTRLRRQFGVENILWLRDQEHLQILARDLWNRCLRKGLDPRNLPDSHDSNGEEPCIR